MNRADRLELLFVPALATLLGQAEKRKRSPLTENEVLRMMAQATRFPVPASLVTSLEASRGFRDLSPGSVWEEWLQRRQVRMP